MVGCTVGAGVVTTGCIAAGAGLNTTGLITAGVGMTWDTGWVVEFSAGRATSCYKRDDICIRLDQAMKKILRVTAFYFEECGS
jgi:hypothetical protein